MKICFMCDLHLPFDKNTVQYQMLEFAVKSIEKRSPDLIVFAGDAVCDGNVDNYKYFLNEIKKTGIPFLYIPGNSDLREPEFATEIQKLSSAFRTDICGFSVFALNDSDKTVTDDQLSMLDAANKRSIVFMHHPSHSLRPDCRKQFENWRKSHPDTLVFYAHMHVFNRSGNDISLPAMDPDKSIGEEPCILYFDTNGQICEKEYFPCSQPLDLSEYLGLSCFRLTDIELATRYGLKYLELRPSACKFDPYRLISLISDWRALGGEGLSVHLPDVGMKDGLPFSDPSYDLLIDIGKKLSADRFTQHVPKIPVESATDGTLSAIADFICQKLGNIGENITVGIENMHMTAGERPDGGRRYGYIPEECERFAKILAGKCDFNVGINFDVGHARNNAPFSQRYQIGTWMSMLGEQFVGYHIHQVINENGAFENHMPITSPYGSLISYASLFRMWQDGNIAKAPLILEMRPEGAYEITLNTFLSQERL